MCHKGYGPPRKVHKETNSVEGTRKCKIGVILHEITAAYGHDNARSYDTVNGVKIFRHVDIMVITFPFCNTSPVHTFD